MLDSPLKAKVAHTQKFRYRYGTDTCRASCHHYNMVLEIVESLRVDGYQGHGFGRMLNNVWINWRIWL